HPVRVHRRPAVHEEVVDAVLRVPRPVRQAPQPRRVGLVVAQQRGRRPVAGQHYPAEPLVVADQPAAGTRDDRRVTAARQPPRPGVAEPQRGQHVQGGRLRTAVLAGDPDAHVGRAGLGVVGGDRPVPPAGEHAGVDQFVLRLPAPAFPVDPGQLVVREGALRIVVPPAHPRVGGRGVEVPPVLLRSLPVVAFLAGQAEDALLDDRVAAVPERQGEAEALLVIADAAEAVLVPPVRPGTRVVVREVVPGGAPGAVVLAHRAPGPLGQVGPPVAPGPGAGIRGGKPCPLGACAHVRRSPWYVSVRSEPGCPRSSSVRRPAARSPKGRAGSGWSRMVGAATPWVPSPACVPVAITPSSWSRATGRPPAGSGSSPSTRSSSCPPAVRSGSPPTSGCPAPCPRPGTSTWSAST